MSLARHGQATLIQFSHLMARHCESTILGTKTSVRIVPTATTTIPSAFDILAGVSEVWAILQNSRSPAGYRLKFKKMLASSHQFPYISKKVIAIDVPWIRLLMSLPWPSFAALDQTPELKKENRRMKTWSTAFVPFTLL